MSEQVRITTSDLTQKVNEGWKKNQLAEHYGLPVAQMTKVLRDAGLRIRKFHNPKYVLVDDINQEMQQEQAHEHRAVVHTEPTVQQEEVAMPEATAVSANTEDISW